MGYNARLDVEAAVVTAASSGGARRRMAGDDAAAAAPGEKTRDELMATLFGDESDADADDADAADDGAGDADDESGEAGFGICSARRVIDTRSNPRSLVTTAS